MKFSLKDIIGSSAQGTHCAYVKFSVDIPAILITFIAVNLTKVTANMLTYLGAIFAILSALSVFNNDLVSAGLWFYCCFICDFVDGKVARLRKTASHFGKKLDLAFDRLIFCGLTLVYIYHFDKNEMILEQFLLIIYAMLFLTYDVLEVTASMVWQRDIIDDLLAGKSVEAKFGINNFKSSDVEKDNSSKLSYFDNLKSIKFWVPSKLISIGIVFSAAPLLSFNLFYVIALVALTIRMLWFLRTYFSKSF